MLPCCLSSRLKLTKLLLRIQSSGFFYRFYDIVFSEDDEIRQNIDELEEDILNGVI